MAVVWFIVKIVLWLLAAIVLLVAAALLVPITAELCYEKGSFTAAVRVLALRFRIYPFSQPKQDGFFANLKSKGTKSKQKSKSAQEPSANRNAGQATPQTVVVKEPQSGPVGQQQAVQQHQTPQKDAPSPPQKTGTNKSQPVKKQNGRSANQKFLWSLDTIKALVTTAGGVVRRVLAGLLVHDICIVMPVQMEDAAATAFAVGGIHAGLHATLGVLNNFFRLRFKQLVVIPDYTGEYEGQEHFSCKVTTHLIIMVVIAVWAFMRLKKEKIIR